MADHDRMLDTAEAARWGLVRVQGDYISLNDLKEKARSLQNEAVRAKLAGNHKRAVQLYRELLPHVRILDELQVFGSPAGMAEQLVQRAIDVAELGVSSLEVNACLEK